MGEETSPSKTMKLSEILDNLKAPIPSRLISQKKLKGNSIAYVAWYDLCDLLDDLTDSWEWEIKEVRQITGQPPEDWEIEEAIAKAEKSGKKAKLPKQKDYLALTGILTIHGEDRSLSRSATGIEEVNCSSYGDPSSNAEAMALRRACAKFGLGRDLWRKDKPNHSKPVTTNAQLEETKQAKLPPGQVTQEQWLKLKARQNQ